MSKTMFLKCELKYYNKAIVTWKVKGRMLLSMTSIKQKANIKRTKNLPYMELRVTHKWELKENINDRKSEEK